MRKHLSTIVLVLLLLIGLSLLLYPTVSDYWNSFHQTRAIATYAENVAALDNASYDAIWDAARQYNRNLCSRSNSFLLSEEQKAEYESLLDISGQGVMGYIEIPEIDVSLPIYHGTEDPVLQVAVGHLEWTSLPVGGESTHCVLSGHRGLPSAKLFTDLDKLEEGDCFYLHILDETLAYQVDQIKVVEPEHTEDLEITAGQDYCTLVTCTPYAINTHRMLVRGTRIPYNGEEETNTPQAVQYQALRTGTVVKRVVDAWPWIAVTGSIVIGGEALLLLLLLHRCKKREEDD